VYSHVIERQGRYDIDHSAFSVFKYCEMMRRIFGDYKAVVNKGGVFFILIGIVSRYFIKNSCRNGTQLRALNKSCVIQWIELRECVKNTFVKEEEELWTKL
jgi:hypothetical protein